MSNVDYSTLLLATSHEQVWASIPCAPYEGPHLNESAWQSQVEAQINLSEAICRDMTPRRCDPTLLTYLEPQRGPSPYNITVSSHKVKLGETLTVKPPGIKGVKLTDVKSLFKFMDQDSIDWIEVLLEENAPQLLEDSTNAIMHANNFSIDYKTDITWIAPEYPTRVVFYGTISFNFSEFWVGVASAEVVVEQVSNCADHLRFTTVFVMALWIVF
ncbi:hypothetical protein C0J52_10522 [Blattella germanica]|nr:hypothetical protein C0J52_10522 [Blattella germanica]